MVSIEIDVFVEVCVHSMRPRFVCAVDRPLVELVARGFVARHRHTEAASADTAEKGDRAHFTSASKILKVRLVWQTEFSQV